jgi:hypothetical protein
VARSPTSPRPKTRKVVEAAQEEADLKKPKFLKDFDVPKDDWVKWIGDHLELEAAFELASFKITPTTIEFEGWVFGLGGGVKLDMLNSTLEYYSSFGPKGNIGIKVANYGVAVEARVDLVRNTTTWEFETGKMKETYTAISEVKGSIDAGVASASGGVKVQIDAQLVSKVETSISAKSGAGQFNAKEVWD